VLSKEATQAVKLQEEETTHVRSEKVSGQFEEHEKDQPEIGKLEGECSQGREASELGAALERTTKAHAKIGRRLPGEGRHEGGLFLLGDEGMRRFLTEKVKN
jgi:hypothetical protein